MKKLTITKEKKIASCKGCLHRKRYFQWSYKAVKPNSIDICMKEGKTITTGARRKTSLPIPEWCKLEEVE